MAPPEARPWGGARPKIVDVFRFQFGKMLQGPSPCESTVALSVHAYGRATGLLVLPRMTRNMRIPYADSCHHPVILLWDHGKPRSSVQAESPMLAP